MKEHEPRPDMTGLEDYQKKFFTVIRGWLNGTTEGEQVSDETIKEWIKEIYKDDISRDAKK